MSTGLLIMGAFNNTSSLSDFSPTLTGKTFTITPDIVVSNWQESEDSSPAPGTSSAWGRNEIWVIDNGTDIEIRVAGDGNGNGINVITWYDTSDIAQSAPPDDNRVPGTTIFELNERSGVTVKIRVVSQPATSGMTYTKIGSYTDNSFFSLTQDVDYGWQMEADAEDPTGPSNVLEQQVIEFTFAKSGYNNYTVTYEQEVDVGASWTEEEPE